MSAGHALYTDPDCWDAIADGRKTFEIRIDDRDYRVGDLLDLGRLGQGEIRELRNLQRGLARGSLGDGSKRRLQRLRGCPWQRVRVTSKVRLTGAVVPAEPHWWKPVEAMQHGVAVMGIEREEQ